jgi:prepilin-type N-terminal cleavage/methylation domain-containing protein
MGSFAPLARALLIQSVGTKEVVMQCARVHRESRREAGVTLPELLVVLAIGGLVLSVGVAIVSDQVRSANIRGAADQFAVDLRAARMIAVSRQANVDLVVQPDPQNRYSYTRADGIPIAVELPPQVKIVSSSPTTIQFRSNGSVTAAATTVIEISLSGNTKERWTVTTSAVGVPAIVKTRVSG